MKDFEDNISVEFTNNEISSIEQALQGLRNVLKNKTINLNAEKRQEYGSIDQENKLLVEAAIDTVKANEDWVPRTLDKDEYLQDFEMRNLLEKWLDALNSLVDQVRDTKIMVDNDTLNYTYKVYKYAKYLDSENEPGISPYFAKMKQHFKGGRKKKADQDDSND